MQLIDYEAEARRAELYSDMSRFAFVIFVVALLLVASFACFTFFAERAGG